MPAGPPPRTTTSNDPNNGTERAGSATCAAPSCEVMAFSRRSSAVSCCRMARGPEATARPALGVDVGSRRLPAPSLLVAHLELADELLLRVRRHRLVVRELDDV